MSPYIGHIEGNVGNLEKRAIPTFEMTAPRTSQSRTKTTSATPTLPTFDVAVVAVTATDDDLAGTTAPAKHDAASAGSSLRHRSKAWVLPILVYIASNCF
ncbi:hypothetical protein AUP68_15450 [Ilyonectria robusta]